MEGKTDVCILMEIQLNYLSMYNMVSLTSQVNSGFFTCSEEMVFWEESFWQGECEEDGALCGLHSTNMQQ